MIRGNDPILLTPGPLTTSLETKQAMLRDWGSWDASFNAITASICKDLVDVVHGAGTHVCVPLQGSGTFSVEAALANLVPRDGKVLVPQNGAYCQRILKILKYLGRASVALDMREDQRIIRSPGNGTRPGRRSALIIAQTTSSLPRTQPFGRATLT